MRYAILGCGTVIVVCLLIILALVSRMVHITSTCTWHSTFNPIEAVGMEAIDFSNQEAVKPIPTQGIRLKSIAPKEILDGKE